jgi:hypothetical protein
MQVFDGLNKEWIYGLIPSERKNHKISNQKFDNFEIISRIGSPSTAGEVYKIEFEDLQFAAKVLPILNDVSFESNKNEIDIALRASELILQNESIYFPIVYHTDFCLETHFYKFNGFQERSLRYQQFQSLYNSTNNQEIKNKITYYRKRFLYPEKVKELLNLDIEISNKVTSNLLISELACCDLNWFLSNTLYCRSSDTLSNISCCRSDVLLNLLNKIFLAIQDMQFKLKILHGDLHLGNILIIKSDNEYIPLIHDFGRSRYLNVNNLSFEREHDIFYFMAKFEEKIQDVINDEKILHFVSSLLEEIVDIFNKSDKDYPIVDICQFMKTLL